MPQHFAFRRITGRLNVISFVAATAAVVLTATAMAQYPQTQWPDTRPTAPTTSTPGAQAPEPPALQTLTRPAPQTQQVPQPFAPAPPTALQPPATPAAQPGSVWPASAPAAPQLNAPNAIQPALQLAIQPAQTPAPAPVDAAPQVLYSAEGDVAANPDAAKVPDAADAADETEDPESELEKKLKAEAEKAKSRFSNALKGDRQAQKEIFTEYVVPAILALLTLIVGYLVACYFGRITGNAVSKRVDVTLGKFAGRFVRNVILLVVVLGILGSFGVPVSGVAAIFAAGSFAVGMALQGTLGNFAAGIMLLVFRPFKVDDYIKVAGIEGRVDEIDLFTTKLDTLDNRRLIVPNGEVFGTVIENCTRNEVRRVDVNVGVAYDAYLRLTRQVLADSIAVIPGAVTQPEPDVYLDSLGASSVDWQLRVWCRPENYWDVRQRVTMAAKDALDAAEIGIPFPQLDLHVVSGNTTAEVQSALDVRRAA